MNREAIDSALRIVRAGIEPTADIQARNNARECLDRLGEELRRLRIKAASPKVHVPQR